MFTDSVHLTLKAGRGGDGIIAWRREKYIPKGGPTGGNGGIGGSVLLQASNNIHALDHLRGLKLIQAENGKNGGPNLRRGKTGKTATILVPVGTEVRDEDDNLLFDLTEHGEEAEICKGGFGGRGNATFKSSRNRAPKKCTRGKPGEEKRIHLNLKILADIGLIGFPNAGKSSLLSALSNIEVKIGDYPFTTLVPNLSYIEHEDYSRTMIADIPGLIKGASENKGLGHQFLKHIERTRALVFVLDAANSNPLEDYHVLIEELKSYSKAMLEKPRILLLNKCDLPDSKEPIALFKSEVTDFQILTISATQNIQIEELKKVIKLISY